MARSYMWNQKQARGFKLYSQPKQSSHQFHQRTARDCPMKRLAMALIAGSATGLSFVAVLQPLPSPAQTISAVPSQEFPKAYVPGLGEFMGRIQVDHTKLWLAGEAHEPHPFDRHRVSQGERADLRGVSGIVTGV